MGAAEKGRLAARRNSISPVARPDRAGYRSGIGGTGHARRTIAYACPMQPQDRTRAARFRPPLHRAGLR